MKPKGRPRKPRTIEGRPVVIQFSPRGKPGRPDEVELIAEEFEALRLADYKGKTQAEAAKSMKISQQTFSRTVTRARKAIAEALVKGKIIKIRIPKQLTFGWAKKQ